MTLSLSQRTEAEIYGALSRRLQCTYHPAALWRALVAEHIRAATYSASAYADGAGLQPLHTMRLMATLRRNLDGLSTGLTSNILTNREGTPTGDSYRAILNDLRIVGDVADTGGGFWISAPLRVIETTDPEWLLVIGGAPKQVVEAAFAATVECAATARFVRRARVARPALDALQPLEAWLGYPEPLRDWTQRLLAARTRRLSRPEETSADAPEIYVPDIYRDQKKQGRWMAASDIHQPLAGLRLCRPRAPYARPYDRPYYFGLFRVSPGSAYASSQRASWLRIDPAPPLWAGRTA
ncbi:MAG: hypothetical protein ACLPSW_14960 [Roseiarcus sp.]